MAEAERVYPMSEFVKFNSDKSWEAIVPIVVGGVRVKAGEGFNDYTVMGGVKFSDLGRGSVVVVDLPGGWTKILRRAS